MKKVNMQIVAIEAQKNRNGLITLSIKVKSEEVLYTFAVKEDDYLDEKTRNAFHQDWLRTIKKSQVSKKMTKSDTEKKEKKVKDLIGREVEEIVY